MEEAKVPRVHALSGIPRSLSVTQKTGGRPNGHGAHVAGQHKLGLTSV